MRTRSEVAADQRVSTPRAETPDLSGARLSDDQIVALVEQLARQRAGRIKPVEVDVDAAPQKAERFTVRAVPTLLVMDRGEVLARQAGAAPVPALRTWLDRALPENAGEEAKS